MMVPPSLTVPEPEIVTETGNVALSKFAVTDVAALTVTAHVPVPEQPPPLHPVNVATGTVDCGVAVSVTVVPCR